MIQLILHNIFSFILIISLIVFIHEFGHFFVARLCGVKIEEFAIGFGKKIFSFRDKKKTEWKFCLLPFGGYVKMYGDRNAASMPDNERAAKMSSAEKKISFLGKNVYQRIAIVAAGPLFNILLTILIFTALFRLNGLNITLPIVDQVLPNSAAFEAKMQKGDKILAIDGKKITEFSQVRELVLSSTKDDLIFEIKRDSEVLKLMITPKIQIRQDFFGDSASMKTVGITALQTSHQDLNLAQSFIEGSKETYFTSVAIFRSIGQLIVGQRSIKELGGPVKIAKYSGKSVDKGLQTVLWFMAMISLNLGIMNLLPIPMLDGGHLFFYLVEAFFKKPLSQKTQQIGFRIGFSMLITLMIFTTINDIWQLF